MTTVRSTWPRRTGDVSSSRRELATIERVYEVMDVLLHAAIGRREVILEHLDDPHVDRPETNHAHVWAFATPCSEDARRGSWAAARPPRPLVLLEARSSGRPGSTYES